MCQIKGSQGSRQKALDLDPEKIAIRSILGSARPRPIPNPKKVPTFLTKVELTATLSVT